MIDIYRQKKYKFCIKVSTMGTYEKEFPNFTYEIKCDLTNQIIEPTDFKNKLHLKVIKKSVLPSLIFQEFDTTNMYCVITGYEVSNPNVTGIVLTPFPSRKISVPSDI